MLWLGKGYYCPAGLGKGLGYGPIGSEHPAGARDRTPLFSIILDKDKVRYQQHFTIKYT